MLQCNFLDLSLFRKKCPCKKFVMCSVCLIYRLAEEHVMELFSFQLMPLSTCMIRKVLLEFSWTTCIYYFNVVYFLVIAGRKFHNVCIWSPETAVDGIRLRVFIYVQKLLSYLEPWCSLSSLPVLSAYLNGYAISDNSLACQSRAFRLFLLVEWIYGGLHSSHMS